MFVNRVGIWKHDLLDFVRPIGEILYKGDDIVVKLVDLVVLVKLGDVKLGKVMLDVTCCVVMSVVTSSFATAGAMPTVTVCRNGKV